MTSKIIMNHYNSYNNTSKALAFDADLTSFLVDPSSYSHELDYTHSSDSLFTQSFSNAFAQQPQDETLSSPLGLSPFDYNLEDFTTTTTPSPMLSSYSNSGSIMGLATPELTQLELPNLFDEHQLLMMNGPSPIWDPLDLNGLNLQALLESTSSSTGAISPQLMKLDSPRLEDLILPDFSTSSPSAFTPIATSTTTTTTLLPEQKKKKTSGRKRKEIVLESEAEEEEEVVVVVVEERVVFAKDKFNGTRNTKIKPIDFNAPTMSRSYVIPSITSRKRAPPAISAKLLPTLSTSTSSTSGNKKQKTSSSPTSSSSIPYDEFNDSGCLDPSELPDELLSAIELKRRQNTLAARRSRMRKSQHLEGIKRAEDEARRELEEWKRRALGAEKEVERLKLILGM